MLTPVAFLKFAARASLNAVGGGVAGDLAVEVLPDVARDLWEWWGKGRPQEELRAELEGVAELQHAEADRLAEDLAEEVAGQRPERERKRLAAYLSQVPASIRQSQRRNSDPTGRTVRSGLSLRQPDDLLPFLPMNLPRFRPGDRPPGIGDWELEALLGIGGFGEVWKARNPHFDGVPPAALKFCLDPATKARLLGHEAAILNQVMRQGRHPGIVSLRHTYLSADPPCLEYEFIEGCELTAMVKESGDGLPHRRATRFVGSIAKIVGFAHRLHPPIVHRDLKPANVLVQRLPNGKGTLWVADFGIGGLAAGREIERTRGGATQAQMRLNTVRGSYTPLYASPQQVRGEPPDPRDDVYALGVIWYQLLTGDLTAGRPGGKGWRRRLSEKGMPEGFLDLLEACIEDTPADRPADAADLSARLRSLPGADELSWTSPPPTVPGRPKGTEKPSPEARVEAAPFVVPVEDEIPVVQPAWPRASRAVAAPAPVGRSAQEITNSIWMKLALVPAGRFLMGSAPREKDRQADEGRHEVEITCPFYMSIFPVTQGVYEEVMRKNPSWFSLKGRGANQVRDLDTSSLPVESVSWDEAMAFCRRLSASKEERRAGRVYRLPSEAEWEYACREAGAHTGPFHFGNTLTSHQANFNGRHPYGCDTTGPYRKRPTTVGWYPPNGLGLYDLHGNVREWCADWYGPYPEGPSRDPTGPARGRYRVRRGGCWNRSAHVCRSAARGYGTPGGRSNYIGFRVVVRLFQEAL